MRRHRLPYYDDKDRQTRDFCLDLIQYIENLSKGSEFQVSDYLLFLDSDDFELSVEETERLLDAGIANGIFSNLKCEVVDGVKTYVKTQAPVLEVYSYVAGQVFSRRDNGERLFSFKDMFGHEDSMSRLKQLKQAFDELVGSCELVEKTTDKRGNVAYKFSHKPRLQPDPSVLPAIWKVTEQKPGAEWTLSDLLGAKPTHSQIASFNLLLEDGVFNRADLGSEVVCKGFNASGEMQYALEKSEWF